MKNLSRSISLVIVILFAIGTAIAAERGADNAAGKISPWVWPLPPDKPRVLFIQTIITPQDLGIKKGFFARIWEFIVGEDTANRVMAPHGVVADGQGKVYIADWGGKQVHFFDLQKKKYDYFFKTKMGPFESPIGVALDAEGFLYVTDSVKRRIFVFSGSKNKRVIGDDTLLRPTGIAINKNEKRLYVVDTVGHRIDVFDLSGSRLFSIGKRGAQDGEFNYPTHVAIDSAGDLYVMDSMNFRVQIFDKDGKYLTQFGGNGTSISQFMKPKGIAVDSEKHIWVSDSIRNSVQVFDRTGRLLLIFGRLGTDAGQFDIPTGLFIDDMDKLYVSDTYNYRVQMFQYLKEGRGR